MATTQYFKKISGRDNRVRWIARLVIDDHKSVVGEAWNGTEWIETDLVMDSLVGGDPLHDEITKAEAEALVPAAFV